MLQGSTWKSVEVHNALCSNAPRYHEQIWNDWNNSKKLRDTMCYAVSYTHLTLPTTCDV